MERMAYHEVTEHQFRVTAVGLTSNQRSVIIAREQACRAVSHIARASQSDDERLEAREQHYGWPASKPLSVLAFIHSL
jgi:hypothetical protein